MLASAGLWLLAIAPAGATGPSGKVGRLRSDEASLATKARAAVLQLYSLDARLANAENRLAILRADARTLEQQRSWLLRERRLARVDARLSQQRLASRLRFIYDHGTTSSLDILMGANSLGDALSQLDDANKVAASNADVLGQVTSSQRHLTGLSRALAARRRGLAIATREASATVSRLQTLRGARSAYVDGLVRRQSVDSQRIATLAAEAQAAAARAQSLASTAATRSQEDAAVGSATIDGPGAAFSLAMPELPGTRRLTVTATGYDLGGTTSTGLPVGFGIAAVDPSLIPLGTKLLIPGYGEAIAADTGSSIVGPTIDLWFPTATQAMAWGRRTVTISVD
jgi:3D (Asp-Asp-Asp) domain-containing protein/peptidoglycan hydrolase CwlO-like protein